MNPYNYRRVPVDEKLFEVKPDIIILTHNHLDHTDPETLKRYLTEDSNILVLASGNAWQEVRRLGGVNNNYVMFNRRTRWTESDIEFYAVYAEHSDSCAIGVVISYQNKNYYITGDTLYNEQIFSDLPQNIDVVFLPINGVGNNMNICDAKRFAERINAKYAVPIHWGMFDELNPNIFDFKNTIIPTIYSDMICR